jgi:hypothetical protein
MFTLKSFYFQVEEYDILKEQARKETAAFRQQLDRVWNHDNTIRFN